MTLRAILAFGLLLAPACADARPEGTARPAPSPLASPPATSTPDPDYASGRLGARPKATGQPGAPEGLQAFPAAGEGSLLFVPRSYRPNRPAPFALALHGCCGEARSGLNLWYREAAEHGIILLAPHAPPPSGA
ncbi:MAG TPA: hypothetical protein VHH92_07850, partial [Actinomycetota bacterium]|nr:hypothetical protein [Actinomycetota bacterium]